MNPFQRLSVILAPEGGTRVYWTVSPRFIDPLPHAFQLQVAMTPAPRADEWEDVGAPTEDAFYATDFEKRLTGKSLDAHYRVVLTSPVGTYTSIPSDGLSYLNRREWLHARDHLRQLKKLIRKYTGCYEGFLLKRKRYGPLCTRCGDKNREEPTDSTCTVCYATGIVGGYHPAVPDFLVELSNESSREKVNLEPPSPGTGKPIVIKGACPGDMLVQSRDVFVATRSGRRWNIETVTTLAEYRGFPTKLEIEMRMLNFAHIVYQVPVG